MDPKFQSSFIPKGPIASTGSIPLTNRQTKQGFLGYLSLIIFVISIVTALGVFVYTLYLSSSITKMGSDLEAARTSLDSDTITQISRLNSRITSTQALLSSHIVLSPLFDFIENKTIKSLRWTSFSYTSNNKDGLVVSMQGQAKGYSALAYQASIFNSEKYIKTPVFSDLTLDDKGNVTFTFTATLDPSVVSYKKSLSNTTSATLPTQILTSTTTPVVASTTSTSTLKAPTKK